MKFIFNFLFLISILFCGCSGNLNRAPENKNSTIDSKDNKPIDFDQNGLENLSTSDHMKEIICQVWDFKEDAAESVGISQGSGIELVYRGFCLFSDGNMIKDQRGNMQVGRWTIDDKVKPVLINFYLNSGQKETYKLAYLSPGEMKLSQQVGDKQLQIDLISEAVRHKKPADDPFYISNNSWRIKPDKPESDEQIKKRLKGCIHFFVMFYEDRINIHSKSVSFIGLPSCFKWYGGGIFLENEKNLPVKWINTFYNRQQAMKAYRLADKLLSLKYEWPKNEHNWLKQNLVVLKQMESRVDSL